MKAHGEAGAAQAGFAECLTATTQSKVAMSYDATSAAGSLEAPDSPVKGKMAYAQAPVKLTDASGCLYTWAWAIEKKSAKQDNAWKFISWARRRSTRNWSVLRTAGQRCRPASVSPPMRTPSTRRRPELSPRRPSRRSSCRPGQSRCPAAANGRYPVRRHPRVHRPGHQGQPGHLGCDRRQEDRRRCAQQRQKLAEAVSKKYQGQ